MVLGTVFAGQKIYLHRSVNCHWICVVGITIVTVAFYHVADYSMTKIAFLMDPIESIAIKKDSTLARVESFLMAIDSMGSIRKAILVME